MARPKGVPNKITTELRTMVIEALEAEGGVDVLRRWCREEPAVFGALIRRCMPQAVEASVADDSVVRIDLSHGATILDAQRRAGLIPPADEAARPEWLSERRERLAADLRGVETELAGGDRFESEAVEEEAPAARRNLTPARHIDGTPAPPAAIPAPALESSPDPERGPDPGVVPASQKSSHREKPEPEKQEITINRPWERC